MNYSALFKNLTKEISSGVQYRYLSAGMKILAVIATLPFWIAYGALICVQYVYLFMFNCFASSADYLEGWVQETKKDVNQITEAVIYLVTTPFIFILRVLLSFFSVVFFITWFLTMCVSYIATLGGVRWQPFISKAKYDDDLVLQATTNDMAAKPIIIIGFILFCVYVLLTVSNYIEFNYDVYKASNIIGYIYWAYIVIAIPVTFRAVLMETGKVPATKAQAPVAKIEAPVSDIEDEFPEF